MVTIPDIWRSIRCFFFGHKKTSWTVGVSGAEGGEG